MTADSAESLNLMIAANLRELRKKRNLTLDEMADATGVSKSMLGQIERGECGLSVATLWKISTGLKISFTALMSEERLRAQVIDNKSLTPLGNGRKGFRLYPVFPAQANRSFEILYLELDAGASSESEPHAQGTEEFVLIYEGALDLTVGEEHYTIKAGQSICYGADQPHTYASHCADITRLCMVIRYEG